MSKRTRNHIIEDESRNAFRALLEEQWVCRDKPNDYGIDCEVEIFDDNGNATGQVFWVQLKATDSKNQNTIRSITFKKSKIAQFNNYEIPVLIARYSTLEKSFYTTWTKAIKFDDSENTSIKVKFREKDKWDSQTNEIIKKHLLKVSFLKQGRLRLPIPIYVYNDSLSVSDISPRYIVSALRQEFKRFNQSLENCLDDDKSIVSISLHNSFIETNICNQGIAKLDIDYKEIPDEFYPTLAKLLVANIAMCLYQVHESELCCELIHKENLFDVILKDRDVLLYLLPCLLTGKYYNDVIKELVEFNHKNFEDNFVQLVTQVILMLDKNALNNDRIIAIEFFLKEQVVWAEKLKEDKLIGIFSYNLGNHYRSINKTKLAFENYIKAQKHFKAYLTHSYFYHELGGLFHELGKFNWSSNSYKKALDLGAPVFITKALYADSLMYSGNYKLARDVFDDYLSETIENKEENDEWYLKFACLTTLLENGYTSVQSRNRAKATDLINKGKYEEALECDLLYDLAWFNLGIQEYHAKNMLEATIAFTMAALLLVNDVEAWVNATLCSISLETSMILYHLVRLAYYYNGEKYIIQIQKQLKTEEFEFVNSLLEAIDKTIPKEKKDIKTLRIFDSDNTYKTIEIGN